MSVVKVLLSVLTVASVCGAGDDATEVKYPLGDPRACMKTNTKIERFEVLPGIGWDNLRNKDAGLVVVYNYSKCRTTEDSRFLIPDTVNTIPLKESKLNTYAELITHWTNYTSTTSRGVNVDVGVTFDSGTISGHFGDSYENVKSKQIGDRSYTTRVQLRYVRYTAKLQPDTELHPTFRSRLLNIAADLELNKTAQARYQSELLVRDFGTHVITSVDAGAALVQEDQVASEFVKSSKYTKNQITAGASASLAGLFKFSVSVWNTESEQFMTEYKKQRSSSQIETIGGPLLKAINSTANDWTKEVDRDLVAVDRSGDPIFYLITEATLPELPATVVYQVASMVEDAVRLYYEFNTYRGCTDLDSPNFSPAANLDDGTCSTPYTNMTFGGVYQNCILDPGSNNGNLCEGKDTKNPKTGRHTCPDGYESVQLHTGHLADGKSVRSCHSCYLFFHCCHNDYHHSSATYTIHWCAAKGAVPQESGYLFGGLYTSKISNPLTQSKSCPVNFYPRLLGNDLQICISDDYELGTKFAIPFGGFISCTAGNPLAMDKKSGAGRILKAGLQSLHAFYANTGQSPKHCPKGYSQHLAYVDQGCAIDYCLQTGALSSVGLPKIRRPPFQEAPLLVPAQENLVMFDPDTKQWRKNADAMQFIKSQGGDANSFSSNTGSMSPGAAAGISVGATLAVVALTTIIIIGVRRRRKSGQGYRNINDPLIVHQGGYGATGSGDTA